MLRDVRDRRNRRFGNPLCGILGESLRIVGDGVEGGAQTSANRPRDNGCGNRNQRSDEAVFDRGSSRLVSNNS